MTTLLVTVTGPDRPGIASELFARLAKAGARVADVEQLQIQGRLLLCVLVETSDGNDAATIERALAEPVNVSMPAGVAISLAPSGSDPTGSEPGEPGKPGTQSTQSTQRGTRQLVTVLGELDSAQVLGQLLAPVTATGANIDRIVRLSSYPVTSYELTVSGGDAGTLRRSLAAAAAQSGVDVAVQPEGLHRRAKHLIVLDVDSTLVQGEIVDLLADHAGRGAEVAAVTAAAMAGELEFEESLRRRVALLAGLEVSVVDQVRREVSLTPGARTLIRTLRRLGYVTALVSGGFHQVIEPLVHDLHIDYVAANVLELSDGRLTGRLVGPVVGRAGKAEALVRFAAAAGVPLARTVAVGDGANDLDMLARAGLGIAFNAKPVVREAADAAINVPYLDAVLFLLGLSRREIEAADAEAESEIEAQTRNEAGEPLGTDALELPAAPS